MSSPRSALPSPRFAPGRDGLLLALGPDQWLEFLLHLCLGQSPLCIPSLSDLSPRRLMEVKKTPISEILLTEPTYKWQQLWTIPAKCAHLEGKRSERSPKKWGPLPYARTGNGRHGVSVPCRAWLPLQDTAPGAWPTSEQGAACHSFPVLMRKSRVAGWCRWHRH